MKPEFMRRFRRRRTPFIMQTEMAECGMACLVMVAGFHGCNVDLGTMRRRFAPSSKGLRLTDLIAMALTLGLGARPVRLELDAIEHLTLPAILHWDLNHFVVLDRIGNNTVDILDPARGKLRMSRLDLSHHFTGIALELRPLAQFEPKQDRTGLSIRQLLGRRDGLAARAIQILALSLCLEAATLSMPLFSQLLIDRAVGLNDQSLVPRLAGVFVLILCAQVALSVSRNWLLAWLGSNVNLRLSGNLFQHLIRLPLAFFARRHLGEITSRFDSLEAIQRTLTVSFLMAMLDGVMAVATLGMMIIYGRALTLVVLVAVGLYVIVRVLAYRLHRAALQEQIANAAQQHSHLLESLRGAQSIKLFGREGARAGTWQNLCVAAANGTLKTQRFNVGYQATNNLLFGLENITVLSLGSVAILEGGMSVGQLFAFMAFKLQFVGRVSNLIERAAEYSMLDLHRERVADIALHELEHDQEGDTELPLMPPSLTLVNVSFRHAPTEPFILQGVNLHIEGGDFVALTGPSGCGKTTLMKIMLGLLEPTEGEVLVSGVPIRKIGLRRWRSITASVMQDDVLFAGSISDNISFFDSEADLDAVRTAAQLADLHEDVASMPMGYQTLVGDLGGLLSGGQRQRLLLARAIYRKPQVLLLDEATSHLDSSSERHINVAVQEFQLTRVMIAHREETIRMARRVIHLPSCIDSTAMNGGVQAASRQS